MEDLKRYRCGEGSLPLGAEGRCGDTAEQGAKALASEAECIVDRGEESLRLTLVEGACLELLLDRLAHESELLVRMHCRGCHCHDGVGRGCAS